MSQEEWRPAPGYPNYEVSSFGRVRRATAGQSTYKGKILKGYIAPGHGYRRFTPCSGSGRQDIASVHRLVAEAFLGPAPPEHEVNHIDGDRSNNHVTNLEWVTRAENYANARKRGTAPMGETVGTARLSREQVQSIRWYNASTELSQYEIADRFGVAQSTVGFIVRRETWKHLPKLECELI